MANALNVHEGKAPDAFTEQKVLEAAFGVDAIVSVVVAETQGDLVGYAMFESCYNTDSARRDVFLDDLFVVERKRGRGIGRALLAEVCREAKARRAATVAWAVRSTNTRARSFYRSVGATDEDLRLLKLENEALERMALEEVEPCPTSSIDPR
jgi:ribosomal protein S18 acetylase RimI-like enzyme